MLNKRLNEISKQNLSICKYCNNKWVGKAICFWPTKQACGITVELSSDYNSYPFKFPFSLSKIPVIEN